MHLFVSLPFPLCHDSGAAGVAWAAADLAQVTAWTNECTLGPTICNTIASLSPFGCGITPFHF